MSDGPEWFAPRRHGFGSGLPVSWQGWLLTLVYAAAMLGAALLFKDRPIQMVAAFIPFTAAYMVICARTTRGGWRWRWGEDD